MKIKVSIHFHGKEQSEYSSKIHLFRSTEDRKSHMFGTILRTTVSMCPRKTHALSYGAAVNDSFKMHQSHELKCILLKIGVCG